MSDPSSARDLSARDLDENRLATRESHTPHSLRRALTGGPLGDSSTMFTDIAAAGGPGDQWDALPSGSKMQILIFIGAAENAPRCARYAP